MGIGQPGGFDDLGVIALRAEAGDVFGNRAVKQLHPLWQIPDIAAQVGRIILIKRSAIQPDFATRDPPGTRQGPRKGRFARPGWSDHANRLTRLHGKRNKPQCRDGFTGRHDSGLNHVQLGLGGRQGCSCLFWWHLGQQLPKVLPAL